MIVSTKGKLVEQVARNRTCPKGFPSDAFDRAKNKLAMVNAASQLDDLKSPPGNELEKLSGDRKGQHSIRINRQWRICFVWTAGGPADVEVVDYH
ncbi:MAG: type II toxin-antitoxin system RelE/ParE family toxin [Devosia sp.]